jgi:hypothetical protein
MMGEASAQKFADVIAENSTLQELYLNSNRITEASAINIAKHRQELGVGSLCDEAE